MGIGSSAVWANTSLFDPVHGTLGMNAGGPNGVPNNDNVMNCNQLTAAFGSDALLEEGMSCYD